MWMHAMPIIKLLFDTHPSIFYTKKCIAEKPTIKPCLGHKYIRKKQTKKKPLAYSVCTLTCALCSIVPCFLNIFPVLSSSGTLVVVVVL